LVEIENHKSVVYASKNERETPKEISISIMAELSKRKKRLAYD
jgi:CxxC motif-containing protein